MLDKELYKNLKEEWDEGLFFYSKFPLEDFPNLRCQILFDTNKSYLAYNHKPCVFIWNGYTNECTDFIAISISNEPEIIYIPKKLNIYKEDLYRSIDYIKENYIVFLNAATEKVGLFDTLDILLGLNESYNITKPKMHILKPHETGLPFKIWIDTGNTWKTKSGHGPRIKIEVLNEKKSDNWVSVFIPDCNIFNNINSKGKLVVSDDSIKLIKKYISFNKQLLIKIIDSSCNITYYKECSIKLDKDGNPIYPVLDKEPDYIIGKQLIDNYYLVYCQDSKYNVLNKVTKKLLFSQPIDVFMKYIKKDDHIIFYGMLGEDILTVKENFS